jgi:hypothetical protein
LTKAFHTSGVLTKNNAVTKIKSAREFVGGGAGLKCIIEVEYKHDVPYLHKELFIKLPHKEGTSDRYYVSCMWNHDRPEQIFYIWLEKFVPFRVPKLYFCDICADTSNYILITEKIPYAEAGKKSFKPGEIEPPYDKHKDWELPDPPGAASYYLACLRAIGRMAGMYKSKQLHPDIETMFPMPFAIPGLPKDLPGLDSDAYKMLSAKIDSLVKFMGTTAKAVMPPEITTDAYLASMKDGFLHVQDYVAEIQLYLSQMDLDYVSLTHTNVQIDNAFFWTSDSNELEVGLLDWGVLNCVNLSCAIFSGCVSGAEPDVIVANLDSFIAAAVDSYADNGGPALDHAKMKKMVLLTMANDFSALSSNVTQVLKNLKAKEWEDIKDWMDPRLQDRFQARVHTTRFKIGLKLWQDLDLYTHFKAWIAEMGLPATKR